MTKVVFFLLDEGRMDQNQIPLKAGQYNDCPALNSGLDQFY